MSAQGKEQESKCFLGSKGKRRTRKTKLPPKNYLHMTENEKIDTPNLISIYQHEYKSKHFQFGTALATDTYREEVQNNTRHCNKMIKELNITGDDLRWVGDEMVFHEEWPIKSNKFRIAQLNVNGLSFAKDNIKIDMYLQGLMAFQVDVATMQEINLNLNNSRVGDKFNKAMKRYDQRGTLQLAKTKHNEKENTYMPGGNAVWSNGVYTGRIERKGQEQYGRWAFIVYLGKNMTKIMVISAYNTCKNVAEDGSTIAGQLRRAMHKNGDNKKNLRNSFFTDLQEFIVREKKEGTEIILGMDANTNAKAEELKTLRLHTSLVDVFKVKHPTKEHPRTYFRGKECLDYIYASPHIAQGISSAGYAPFYAMGKYDHRLLYVDIHWDHIFKHKVDVTQARGRQLSVKNRRITKLYKKTLKALEKKAGVYRGVEKILARLQKPNQVKDEREYCINKLQTYKTVMMQLMVSANNKATKSKPSIFQWSVTLRNNGQQMRYWNERKKSSENGDSEGLQNKIPKGYIPPTATTHDEVMEEYHKKQAEWIKTKDASALLHHQFMIDLIEHIEEKRGCSKETAQKYLYHQEATRAGHEKQSRYLKKQKRGLLTELLVPTPHTKDIEAHIRVSDEESIEKILLRRNKSKLCEAVVSPFCKGPLANSIDENGKCKVSKSIVEGTYDTAAIDGMEIENKKEIKMLMKELVRKRDKKGNLEEDVSVTISMKDFQGMFNKKRETTSCGPFGIIMPHWKIMAEDDYFSTLQARLMEAPFKYGFTYKEWEVSVHCMLMKDELPYYHRLRIIQLFEGDLNGALQLLFGRRQMDYMDKHGLNSDATYGGRKGKGCHQALNRIQYTTLYSRIMRQLMGLVDVDATGCFDRMVGRLLSLINQCNGMSQEAAACQAEVLHNMKHYVKTTRGISENYIERSKDALLEGNGQGNAASVPGWHGHNELLCKIYKKLIHGSKITSPDRRIDFEQWLTSFIDDNKMLLSFKNDETYENIIDKCQQSLQIWETLLNITGGAVELRKCFITILRYSKNASYQWYNKRPGVPLLKTTGIEEKQCIITREGEKGVIIRQQDTTEGVRLLGIMAAANGTYKQEYNTRLDKSREIAGRLLVSPLNIALSWQAYFCRWRPAITYCLPITTFTAKECMKIQSPFFNALLPKLGINRHMPRDLLHGPTKIAGLGLVNLEAEQLAMHVSGMIAQIRKKDRVGQTMLACIDAMQIYLGTGEQFFSLQAHTIEYRPDRRESQLTYIWEELNSIGCKLYSKEFWTPTERGNNDSAVMDAIVKMKSKRQGTSQHLPKQSIWHANACRLYLKITMLHEICTPCGKYIHDWAMDGSKQYETDMVYPFQDKPPKKIWKVWRECILATYLKQSDIWRPTLHTSLTFKDRSENISWRNRIFRGMKMEEALLLIPGYLKEAIGTIRCPIDNGRQLSEELQTSETASWTDGTVKHNIGAHAYTIRTKDENEENCISGSGGTPGDPTSMTSLRAEHFGVLVIIVLLDIVTLIHGNSKKGKHAHYTDSRTVIMRLQETEYMTDRQYDSTDYDIWESTAEAIREAGMVTLKLHHVKGHQREEMHNVRKEQGPLTREATFNDWCDQEADKEREDHQIPAQISYIDAAKVYLRTATTLVTASSHKAIYEMKTWPAAEEYVQRKLGLTMASYRMINWEAMGNYVNTLAISQKVKVMKYIYDWQNVGMQKKLHQWVDEDEYMCPFKCGKKEASMHYLNCSKSFDNMSIMCLEAINKWMIRARTNNAIRTELMEKFYQQLPRRRPVIDIRYTEPKFFERAKEEQDLLGWNLTMKGLFSKEWGKIQDEEYERIREREGLEIWYTGTWWTKQLIKNIIFWALNEWQKRNECLHQEVENRLKEQKRKECQKDIMELYNMQENRPIAKLKRYFNTPLIDKLQQNPTRQRQWIESIRALKDKTAMQNKKNRLAMQTSMNNV